MGHINQLEPGTLLVGRYQIVKRIGGGGMGSVYLARDKRLADAPRAVKEMIGMFNDEAQRKKAVEDFERESQLLASLDHPAIPTIYDYFISEGCYYLVMKFIGGGDLAGRLKDAQDGRLDERSVVEYAIQICDVLAYLHSQQPLIIYRDMKPANIMLDERNRVMLVDFGIARFVASTQKNVTAIGTMGYAPPELFAGRVEPRSDIYSLGATMFHLLTGRDPQDNPLLMFDFNRNPRPRNINSALTPEIDAIICKAVEHKPANRFASAAEMKKALEEHRDRLNSANSPYDVPTEAVPLEENVLNYCGKCGHQLGSGDLFCNHCGNPQPQSRPPVVAAQLPASVVFIGANQQPISFLLEKTSSLIGRTDTNRGIYPDIDLTPYDKEGKVSRRHALIHRDGNKYFIEDLASTNGTFVNNKLRLQAKQPQELNGSDELRLGETVLHFFIGPVPASFISAPKSQSSSAVAGTRKNEVLDAAQVKQSAAPQPATPPVAPPAVSVADIKESAINEVAPAANKPAPIAAEPPVAVPASASESAPISEATPSRNVERYLTDVDFPKQVKLGQVAQLHVGILVASKAAAAGNGGSRKKPHEHDSEIEVVVSQENGEPTINTMIDAYIAAPGFEIEPEIFTRLALPSGGNAAPAIFHLKAIQSGVTTVTVDFYQDPNYLSSVSIETEVV
ncbi:MAG: protein kinase [Acidobacteriota bacterium]